jgi:hypothetical protein
MIMKRLLPFFPILITASHAQGVLVHKKCLYNVENLFDTINGTNNDEEWLPRGMQNWILKIS